MIRGMLGFIPTVVLGGETMGQIGTHMTGSLAGIGRATGSMVGVGILGKATQLFKW